jgi:hypothetical protein
MSFSDTCSSPLCLGGCAKSNYFNLVMPSTNVSLTSATMQVVAKWTDGTIYSLYVLDNEGGVTIFLNGQKIVEVLGASACSKSCPSYPFFCSCTPPNQTYTVDITNLLQPQQNTLEVREDIDCAISAWDLTITITATYASPVVPTTTPTGTSVSPTSPVVIYPSPPAPTTKVNWTPIIIGGLVIAGIIAGVAGYMSASPETKRKVRETAKRAARAAGRAAKKAVTKGAELTKRAIARARGGQS